MNFISYANVLKIIDFWNQNALKNLQNLLEMSILFDMIHTASFGST